MNLRSPVSTTESFVVEHLEKRSIETALSCLDDRIVWFGTGAFEVVRSKADARKFLQDEISSMTGGYSVSFVNMSETMLSEDMGTVFGQLIVRDNQLNSEMDCRITTACLRHGDDFLISSLHISSPSGLQDDREYYPIRFAKEKLMEIKSTFFDNSLPGGLVCCKASEKMEIIYANEFFAKMLGYCDCKELMELGGGCFSDLISADKDLESIADCVISMPVDTDYTFTYRIRSKTGNDIWLRDCSHKYLDENNLPVILCFCTDITDIVKMETTLKEQKNALKFAHAEIETIINKLPCGVYRRKLDGRFVMDFCSPGLAEMTGYSPDEVMAFSNDETNDLLPEADRIEYIKAMKSAKEKPSFFLMEYKLKRKDGSFAWVADNFRSTLLPDGKIWGFGVVTDIASEKEFEEQLRIREEETRLAMAQLGKMVCRYDVRNRTLTTPKPYADKHGLAEVLPNMPYSVEEKSIIAAESKTPYFSFFEKILNGEKNGICEAHLKCADGSWCWERAEFISIFDADGNPAKAIIAVEDITDLKNSEAELESVRQNEELFKIVAAHSDRYILKYDMETKTIFAQQRTAEVFGIKPILEDMPNSFAEGGNIDQDSLPAYFNFFYKLFSGEQEAHTVIKLKNPSNEHWDWYQFDASVVFNDSNLPSYAVISFENVTNRYEKELAYERISKQMSLIPTDTMLYYELDLTRLVVEREEGLLVDNLSTVIGKDPVQFVNRSIERNIYSEDAVDVKQFLDQKRLLGDFSMGTSAEEIECRMIEKNGDLKWIRITVEMVNDPYSQNVRAFMLLRDINEEKTAELHVLERAETDGLTGLYNKATTEELIRRALLQKNSGSRALIIADVDDLKNINDSLGHSQGDRAIKLIANTIKSHFRSSDIAGRVGGDEFMVFLNSAGSEAHLKTLLTALLNKIHGLRIGETNSVPLCASIGIVVKTGGTDSFESLYKKADKALYKVKRTDKGSFAFYTSDMEHDF